jgi:hypothetical protein
MGAITERLRENGFIVKTYSAEAQDYRLTITESGRQILTADARPMADGRE